MKKPEFTDSRGDVFHKYDAEYEFDGGKWSIEFWARSREEAVGKLRAIRTTACNCVCIEGEIPVKEPLSKTRIRFACWWRNLLGI